MISSKAEYRHEDYRFLRERPDASWRDLERSQPIESWGSGIIHCIAFVGLAIIGWLIAANIAQALQ